MKAGWVILIVIIVLVVVGLLVFGAWDLFFKPKPATPSPVNNNPVNTVVNNPVTNTPYPNSTGSQQTGSSNLNSSYQPANMTNPLIPAPPVQPVQPITPAPTVPGSIGFGQACSQNTDCAGFSAGTTNSLACCNSVCQPQIVVPGQPNLTCWVSGTPEPESANMDTTVFGTNSAGTPWFSTNIWASNPWVPFKSFNTSNPSQEIPLGPISGSSNSKYRVCGVGTGGQIYCNLANGYSSTALTQINQDSTDGISIYGTKAVGLNPFGIIYTNDFTVANPVWLTMLNPYNLVSVTTDGNNICGLDINNNIYCTGFGGSNFTKIPGQELTSIDIYNNKIAGVNSNNQVYYSESISNPVFNQYCANSQGTTSCSASQIPFKQVALNNNLLCGVDTSNNIYCSVFGSNKWSQIQGALTNIAVDKP